LAAKEDKVQIRQFKDSSSQWWVGMAHYKLEQNGGITWCAGETDKKELRESLEAYIKRNKKIYKERAPSVFEQEPKQYNEKIGFGKYANLTVSELVDEDLKYAKWILEKCNLAGKEKLKEQLMEILKK
jgi:hypothetical protein